MSAGMIGLILSLIVSCTLAANANNCISQMFAEQCILGVDAECMEACAAESLGVGRCGRFRGTVTLCYCNGCTVINEVVFPSSAILPPTKLSQSTTTEAITAAPQTTDLQSYTGYPVYPDYPAYSAYPVSQDLTTTLTTKLTSSVQLFATPTPTTPSQSTTTEAITSPTPATPETTGLPAFNATIETPTAPSQTVQLVGVANARVGNMYSFATSPEPDGPACFRQCFRHSGCFLVTVHPATNECFLYLASIGNGFKFESYAGWEIWAADNRNFTIHPDTEYSLDDLHEDGQPDANRIVNWTVDKPETCLKLCKVHPLCNAVTYSTEDGCWLKQKAQFNPISHPYASFKPTSWTYQP